ncbi:MAG TPA: ABC transporter transmembrane domain-containing protein, partial [Clostridium sp.]
MLLSSYIQTLFPKVLGNTVDILKINGFNPKLIYIKLIYILLIAVGTFVSTYAWRNLVIGNSRGLECHLREKLFDHFQKLSPEFYNQRKTGNLIAYAINDINAVRMAFGPATSMSINGIVVCGISIYSMANTINWKLTLLALLPVPFIIWSMVYIGNVVKKHFRRVQETFSSISDRVQENITGIRVIKAYGQEDSEVKKFQELNDQMVEANLSMVRISAYLAPLIELCFTISFVLNLIWGGNMVLKGSISLGDFIAFNGYLSMILVPVISIGKVITVFQRGMASLDRLNEIFKIEPHVKDGVAMRVFSAKGSIKITNLSFSYHNYDKEVLSDINLVITKGHTLGIIGKTGSGKSTLVNLLLKMYNVDNNKILFDGIDIN